MTIRRSASMTLIAVLFALALVGAPFVASAQPPNNSNNNTTIPTLDGFGLASLAGGLAIAGSWVAARRRRRK